jgi:hypothetical protein
MPSPPSNQVVQGSLTVYQNGVQMSSNPDAQHWDVIGNLPRAYELAKATFSDAVLVRIDASGVYPDGKADLTLDTGFNAIYRFMSPSRNQRPKELPLGVDHHPTCMFYVLASSKHLMAYPVPNSSCDDPPVHNPRCDLKAVWKKAAAQGAPTKNAVSQVGYWATKGEEPRWYFKIDGNFSEIIPDDC